MCKGFSTGLSGVREFYMPFQKRIVIQGLHGFVFEDFRSRRIWHCWFRV